MTYINLKRLIDFETDAIETNFKEAAFDYKYCELFLYKLLNHCLQAKKDLKVDLKDEDSSIKTMLSYFSVKNEDLFKDSAFDLQLDNNSIYCRYDIYKILNTVESIEEIFGTVNFNTFERCLDSDAIELSEKEIDSLDDSIKKGALVLDKKQ